MNRKILNALGLVLIILSPFIGVFVLGALSKLFGLSNNTVDQSFSILQTGNDFGRDCWCCRCDHLESTCR